MNRQKEAIMYSPDEMAHLEAYIELSFGEFAYIFHEKVSEDVHFDIAVIEPTNNDDYYKLVSMGGGAYKMNIPPGFEGELDRAELVMLLPKDSGFDKDDPASLWPIQKMLDILKTPIRENSWIGYGHTFGDGTPLTDGTDMKTIGLVTACNKNYDVMRLKREDKTINFYQMLPMYDEELHIKQKKGMQEFMHQLHDEDFPLMLNVQRPNRCKQRIRQMDRDMFH